MVWSEIVVIESNTGSTPVSPVVPVAPVAPVVLLIVSLIFHLSRPGLKLLWKRHRFAAFVGRGAVSSTAMADRTRRVDLTPGFAPWAIGLFGGKPRSSGFRKGNTYVYIYIYVFKYMYIYI